MQHVAKFCLETTDMYWDGQDVEPLYILPIVFTYNCLVKFIRLNVLTLSILAPVEVQLLATQNGVRKDVLPCEETWCDDNSSTSLTGDVQLIVGTIAWFCLFVLIILLWMPNCDLTSRYSEINEMITSYPHLHSWQHWEWTEKRKRKGEKKSSCNEINQVLILQGAEHLAMPHGSNWEQRQLTRSASTQTQKGQFSHLPDISDSL